MELTKSDDAEQALQSLSEAFHLFHQAIQMARGAIEGGKSQAADKLLAQAELTSKLAEAALARHFGYQLCQCQFPPTPMLLVGYRKLGSAFSGAPVYECRLCKTNTAMPEGFKRLTRKPRP